MGFENKRKYLNMVFIATLITIFFGCKETVVPNEEFFKQNTDWLKFAPDYYDFIGISYNIDNNFTKLKYKTGFKNHIDYFKHVDSIANNNDWIINNTSVYCKVYRRKSDAYPAAKFNDMITINFDTISKEIIFDYKPDYE